VSSLTQEEALKVLFFGREGIAVVEATLKSLLVAAY
jgi:hypothetical protein